MTPEELRAVAAKMATSLGVSVFIRNGRIHELRPGEEVKPPKSPHAPRETHGRFTIAAAAKPD